MHDWKQIVRERLTGLRLEGSREAEIIDEIAQHLEDRYQELLASGVSEPEARRIAIESLEASPSFDEALREARAATAPDLPADDAGYLALLYYDLRMALRGMRLKPGSASWSSACWRWGSREMRRSSAPSTASF
jgi:putative ABC transport system permease protein